MRNYEEKEILRLAKRVNNSKRKYLLVNPLQAKHMPVSPSIALQMMVSLGQLVAAKYSEARLVIGFAETATAIGAVVAKTISDECSYIHTTRENVTKAHGYVHFLEEHSHATQQLLVSDDLEELFGETDTVVFVDDEFSTGKTLINMIHQLEAAFPVLSQKRIVAASIINRLSDEHIKRFEDEGIQHVCLLKLPFIDYTSLVDTISVSQADRFARKRKDSEVLATAMHVVVPDPRVGVNISDYFDKCTLLASVVEKQCDLSFKDVLIIGTEECMLPALLIGNTIEKNKTAKSVSCHATTRSPIGVADASNYPVTNGFQIPSFYDFKRETYIYNLRHYDVVVIVSDTESHYSPALHELSILLNEEFDCRSILCLVGENDG